MPIQIRNSFSSFSKLGLAWSLGALVACGSDAHTSPKPDATVTKNTPVVVEATDTKTLAIDDVPRDPSAASGRPGAPSFCERGHPDEVSDLFCAGSAPSVSSLQDLQALLALEPGYPSNARAGVPVLLAHSTSLSGHLASPINPRAFVLGSNTLLAFQRGVQRVELAALSHDGVIINLYLLTFKHACDDTDEGCRPVDLYTTRIENDWTDVSIRDAEDLKNTPLDCRQCHQRGRDRPGLLMRELESPWTHFFEPVVAAVPASANTITPPGVRGSDLMSDYLAAKGSENYANIAMATFPQTTAFALQSAVRSPQPLFFDSGRIEDERYPFRDGAYATVSQSSPTWESAYEAFKRGEQLALPYVETRATDPDKQQQLTAAYQRYLAGDLDDQDFPDLGDIFPADPHTRARIGLQTEPDATPSEALIQACGTCHNDVLDQSLSRARFNIAVGRLDADELDAAIDRIQRDRSAVGAMPPPEARQLDPDVRERLVEYLREDARSGDSDPQLEHAAQVGMMGGVQPPEN